MPPQASFTTQFRFVSDKGGGGAGGLLSQRSLRRWRPSMWHNGLTGTACVVFQLASLQYLSLSPSLLSSVCWSKSVTHRATVCTLPASFMFRYRKCCFSIANPEFGTCAQYKLSFDTGGVEKLWTCCLP